MNDIQKDHAEMVARSTLPGALIRDSLTADKAHIIHMAVGITSKAGALADMLNKHVIHGGDIDLVGVVDKLGDIEFYLEGLRTTLNVGRSEVLYANTEKVGVKYGSGYTLNRGEKL